MGHFDRDCVREYLRGERAPQPAPAAPAMSGAGVSALVGSIAAACARRFRLVGGPPPRDDDVLNECAKENRRWLAVQQWENTFRSGSSSSEEQRTFKRALTSVLLDGGSSLEPDAFFWRTFKGRFTDRQGLWASKHRGGNCGRDKGLLVPNVLGLSPVRVVCLCCSSPFLFL